MFPSEFKLVVGKAVHHAVARWDRGKTGLWLCEQYALAGAEVLRVLTGDGYRAAAGLAGQRHDAPKTIPIVHASGLPLEARPEWEHQVETLPAPGSHAFIVSPFDETIDFSTKPNLWGRPSELGQHWYHEIARDTAELVEKYRIYSTIIPTIAGGALAEVAPAWLARCDKPGHVLARIAGTWPKLADGLVDRLNTGRRRWVKPAMVRLARPGWPAGPMLSTISQKFEETYS